MSSKILEQYANSKNFMARVELNRRFATNPYRWNLWIFDQIQFPKECKILELGCGNALLWRSNLHRIPNATHILLSDFSEGMVNEARNILKDKTDIFEYEVIDAQQIPYSNCSFDIVIANYMFYHIPDRKKALSEISRVLKPGGAFYVTTFGTDNMKELDELISNYDDRIYYPLKPLANVFGLENGEEQLRRYFENVKLIKYNDKLEVTEAEPLINFVLSFTKVKEAITGDKIKDFKEYVTDILKHEGKINITKKSGMFIAKK